ncbi:MAG: hypothetical protein RLZZ505_2211 [Verrucomicrobiota bacterium]|jgi:hypothetical protein
MLLHITRGHDITPFLLSALLPAPYTAPIAFKQVPAVTPSSGGFVPCWVTHLDGQTSEKIVPSGKGAHENHHENHQGTEEVRRILKSRINHSR